jgi:hypothetical protein
LGESEEGRAEDKASGGGGSGTIYLGIALGMGIAVGMSSFAIDGCWILYLSSILGRG